MTDTLTNFGLRRNGTYSGLSLNETVDAGDAVVVPVPPSAKPTVAAYPAGGATASVYLTNDPDENVDAMTAAFVIAWEPGDVTEATMRGLANEKITGLRLAASGGSVRFAVTG